MLQKDGNILHFQDGETRYAGMTKVNQRLGLCDNDGLLCLSSLTEAILEAARHVTQMTHAASSGGASPLRLERPVVRALLRVRIGARRTLLLLNVVRATAAANAQRMRLARALSIT